ncbi:MAG: anhydro-N-acetylmuramic acid kinase [Sulfurovum sp.]|nr:anhydro-N-acetylmuramic acid kinase [Sulfurovum sp.]
MKEKALYIGIMSGTSLDGVDVVLCEIDALRCKCLASLVYPMPLTLKNDILHSIEHPCTLLEIGELDHRLGLLFAKAVKALLQSHDTKASEITAIGSHGQTLWHSPQGKYPFSMQLGDANIMSTETQIPVVADFRRKDMALGGQGAPFAPAFHAFAFADMPHRVAVVNIGGMANITVLGSPLIGYDIGCGNVLMDTWIHRHKNLSYDQDGTWARSGKVDEVLLAKMLQDRYFTLPYPKSTGREKFNQSWIDEVLSEHSSAKIEDVQRTLLELTAITIANEVSTFTPHTLLVCGGGVKNRFLLERIGCLLPKVCVSIAPHADDIEAMTFAWLAQQRIAKQKVNLKDVTGATHNAILGAIYL